MSVFLETADRLLTTVVRGARGCWPRACAWLLRYELEAAIDRYWQRVCPEIGQARAQRPKLVLLNHYAGSEIGQRTSYLWWVLSRAGHHHTYELGITAAELVRLRAELTDVITLLGSREAP